VETVLCDKGERMSKDVKLNIPLEEQKKIRKVVDDMLPDEENWEQIYHDSLIKSHNVLIKIKLLLSEYLGETTPDKDKTNQ
jgi:hypothetical protein